MPAVLEFRVQLAFWCGSGVSREIFLDVGAPPRQRINLQLLAGFLNPSLALNRAAFGCSLSIRVQVRSTRGSLRF
jgi:hypothetical protein